MIEKAIRTSGSLMPSVHDLGSKVAGVKVRHEAANLFTLYLQNAYALVGNGIAVGGSFGRPLKSRPLLGGEDVAELRPLIRVFANRERARMRVQGCRCRR